MRKTETVNIRIDKELKSACEGILTECGLNLSTAINVFLNQLARQKGIPFLITLNKQNQRIVYDTSVDEPLYNQETVDTLQAIENIEKGENLSRTFKSVKELMEDLDADD